jgi:hypothetical protein
MEDTWHHTSSFSRQKLHFWCVTIRVLWDLNVLSSASFVSQSVKFCNKTAIRPADTKASLLVLNSLSAAQQCSDLWNTNIGFNLTEARVRSRVKYMWDLWWTKWHWDRFISELSVLPCRFHSTGAPLIVKIGKTKLLIHLSSSLGLHKKP